MTVAAQYRPSLDGIRAIAVGAVYVFHATTPLLRGGFVGVDIFFVLSGFLITATLIQEWGRSGRIHFARFYVKRALRLFPALVAMLVAYLLLTQTVLSDLMPQATEEAWGDALIIITYVSNWTRAMGMGRPNVLGHTWSLSTEEQYYVLWPAVLYLFLRFVKRPLVIAGVVVTISLLIGVHRLALTVGGSPIERLSTGLDTRLDGIFLGCSVGVLAANGRILTHPIVQKISPWAAVIGTLCLVVMCFTIRYDAPLTYMYWIPLANLASAVVLLHLECFRTGAFARLLSFAPLVYVGKRSYGIYLYHVPILAICGELGFRNWTRLLILGPLTLLVAEVSYRYWEILFLRRKDSLKLEASRSPRPGG